MGKSTKDVRIVEVESIDIDALLVAAERKMQALAAKGKLAALTKDQLLACAVKQRAARPDIVSFDKILMRLVAAGRIVPLDGRFYIPKISTDIESAQCRSTPRSSAKKNPVPCKRTLQLFGDGNG